jgi:hypothetical protein
VIGTEATRPTVPTALRMISWARNWPVSQGEQPDQRRRALPIGDHVVAPPGTAPGV